MKPILVDSSIWIAFFKGQHSALPLVSLLEQNLIVVNALILSELIPLVLHRKEESVHKLLLQIPQVPLEIDWHELIAMQTANLSSGLNRVGIPDLIIAQNAIQNDLMLFEQDKHYQEMARIHPLKLFVA